MSVKGEAVDNWTRWGRVMVGAHHWPSNEGHAMTGMIYTSHGAMTPEDLAEIRRDYDLDYDLDCGTETPAVDVETCTAVYGGLLECGNALPCPWHSQ